MSLYVNSLTKYHRLPTRAVAVGNIMIGNHAPLVLQTMVNTNTMDTVATVQQCIRCIEAGAEIVRITAPSKKDAENLFHIKKLLRAQGYTTPLVADIHFTPNAADIAAEIVEKVRINPGNYLDKKKFEFKNYSDDTYQEEINKIEEKFIAFLKICKNHHTAIRIGTNHGSLSDRIMSRYGDTPMGMVESAMEFLRIARKVHFHDIVLSMKSSNPLVMVQAYRLLVSVMQEEFGECYPLHLGVTEAGDGEDGRIKSAIGIGALLEDGIGDTIRVSLTENPESEIPVCRNIAQRYVHGFTHHLPEIKQLPYSPLHYQRQNTLQIGNIGSSTPPVVIADLSNLPVITTKTIEQLGYVFNNAQWHPSDMAVDYILTNEIPAITLPDSLKCIVPFDKIDFPNHPHMIPLYPFEQYQNHIPKTTHIVAFNLKKDLPLLEKLKNVFFPDTAIFMFYIDTMCNLQIARAWNLVFRNCAIRNPIIFHGTSNCDNQEQHILYQAIVSGGLLLDGFGDGICVHTEGQHKLIVEQENTIAFSILQATRTRITKTEYISCPSCGRTLFDLMETTNKVRQATHHLKGLKLAIMGCIVNGPGEMADADFGYVGSGAHTINLYKGKDIVKKNIPEEVAVEELINLLKEYGVWKEQ